MWLVLRAILWQYRLSIRTGANLWWNRKPDPRGKKKRNLYIYVKTDYACTKIRDSHHAFCEKRYLAKAGPHEHSHDGGYRLFRWTMERA